MAQLSRPYQIALGAMVVLVMVWFVALRGHSSSSGEPSAASTQSSSPGAPSKIYHGPAPGVEGLTRDVAKAHGAVATSEHDAAQLQRDSAKASGETPAATGGTPVGASQHNASSSTAAQRSVGGSRARSSSGSASRSRSHGSSGSPGRAPQQIEVERELSHGKTVLLLFWEPRSTVDNTVRRQVLALGKSSKGHVAVNVALADQVGLFGPVTEVAHVYQTPTILIVNRHGLVSTLTGLVDTFALKQAVREAQQANR